MSAFLQHRHPLSRVDRPTAPPLKALALGLLLMTATVLAAIVPAWALSGKAHPPTHPLLQSRQLWATVDICNAPNQPHTVGIRGSMPSDGHPRDTMYMRYRLQYLDSTSKHWIDLAQGADSGFLAVGSASSARQAGRSFQLVPVVGAPAFTLRGVVSFQWRVGVRVVHAVTRPTTAGHKSLAGADPAGFSAATCAIM